MPVPGMLFAQAVLAAFRVLTGLDILTSSACYGTCQLFGNNV